MSTSLEEELVNVQIEKGVVKTLSKYPEKIRVQIFRHIQMLTDPYEAPDVECLYPKKQIWRMHVGRSYTIIFTILKQSDTVHVLEVSTIEQAHKRYGRFY
jgi:mRNA-degrading endonuclease RelE of RelBE toxin-antitoxin system